MDPDQSKLAFNVFCFFISVASAIVSGFYYFEARKNLRAYKEEQEKRRSRKSIASLSTS